MAEKLIDPFINSIALVQEVDNHDIVPLAVPMDTSNALLYPLRIPGQVEVHQQRAELEIDALSRRLSGDHHFSLVPKMIDDGMTYVNGTRP